jgi:hypothetical protein
LALKLVITSLPNFNQLFFAIYKPASQ